MRARSTVAAALSALALVAAFASPASATGARYYVSLGDSLSTGYQPGQGNTDQGYVDVLYASLKARDPALKLVKLGCAGEDSTTLLKGGHCSYEGASSQLDAARKFLRAHRGTVRYLTIDIGGNDVDGCAVGGGIDTTCVLRGLGTLAGNLPQITSSLRAAAGPGTRLLAMNYYDPFLAAWLTGSSGQTVAGLSVLLTNGLNGLETTVYTGSGFRVADVATRFATNDFAHQETLPGVGQVPRNVFRICTWTYMCVRNDIHANPTGYQEIAKAFLPLTH